MQARTLKCFVAACGVAAAMACTDDRAAINPTMPPTRVSADLAAPGCDFNAMKQHAKGYFLAGNDPVYTLIQDWSALNKTTDAAAFKQKGFDILAYVGSVAGNSAVVGAASAGDLFVDDVLVCLGFPTNVDFTGALGPNGMFAVPVGSAAVISRGTPVYGVEPTTASWAVSSGQALFLLYGGPRDYSFSNEPAALNATTGAYDLNTIPAHLTFSPPIRGGTCTEVADANTVLQHENEILTGETLNFCATITSSRGTERGVFALARRLSDWFTPRPAYAAATMLAVKPPGGSLGGLSPIGPVVVNAATVKLAFVVQPSNGTINKDIKPPIVVSAVTANGTPLDGVQITLTVLNNQGVPIQVSGNVATTTAGGLATYEHLQTTKAGGYTMLASGSIFGTATKTVTSVLFNVQGKK